MPTTFGPEALPYPQPTDAPDGPGAFLALLQKLVVGGAIPYDTYANMTAGLGTGYNGQLSIVYNDTTKNGVYWSNGSAWSLMTGPRQSGTPIPGTNYSIGLGQVTLRGTQVTANLQFTKSSAMVAGDTAGTLPVGFRPPSLVVAAGFTTTGANVGTVQFQIASTGVVTISYVQAAAANAAWLSVVFETI